MTWNGERRFLTVYAPKCQVVFDVGAHVGLWTEAALQANPDLHVHCFEPHAGNCAALRDRVRGRDVRVNECALGAQAGRHSLYQLADQTDTFSLCPVPSGRLWSGRQRLLDGQVRVDTLDAYCAEGGVEHIDLLKIDVEGSELAVLKGAARMLGESRITCVQFEHTVFALASRTLLADYFDLFREYGYTLYKVYPDGLRRIDQYDVRLESFQYQNWVAARAGAVDEFTVSGRRPLPD
jgi:FkbM family methyltransferase